MIDVAHDEINGDQTFLVGARQTDKIEIARTTPAVITAARAGVSGSGMDTAQW